MTADLTVQDNMVQKMVELDFLKDNYKKTLKQSSFREDVKLSLWLDDVTNKSRITYTHSITMFKEFLLTIGKHWTTFDSFDADRYIVFLKNKGLSNNSILIYSSAVSSFFTQLERWGDVEMNPFKGTKKRPKKIRKKEVIIPSDFEVEVMLRSFNEDLKATGRGATRKRDSAKRMFCVVYLMKRYGFRVGAFENLRWDVDGNYEALTKGKKIEGKFSNNDLVVLNSFGFYGTIPCKTDTIRKAFAMKMEDLGMEYSPHDIRHRFATNHYLENKDIYALKEKLGHSSVVVTENYIHRDLKLD